MNILEGRKYLLKKILKCMKENNLEIDLDWYLKEAVIYSLSVIAFSENQIILSVIDWKIDRYNLDVTDMKECKLYATKLPESNRIRVDVECETDIKKNTSFCVMTIKKK